MTTAAFRKLKGQRPIASVTAYDAPFATLADRAGMDLLLIGDSLGSAVLGFDSTVPVTLEMMLHHSAAVVRARPDALVVGDIPFVEGSRDREQVLETGRRFMQECGVDAVKLEGGTAVYEKVAALTHAGIPVLGHIGLLPQQVMQLGGYRKFGREEAERQALINDALALEASGAFGVVLEMVVPDVAEEITQMVTIPTIGIGSGPATDGQILVAHDLLGLTLGKAPRFAKAYADLASAVETTFKNYADDIRSKKFPS